MAVATAEILVCSACSTQNRVLPETGTRGIRCGRCRADLPTPAITEWLLRVYETLGKLSGEVSYLDLRRRNAAVERELIKQKSVLNNLVQMPGYRRTQRASLALCIEINALAEQIAHDLGNTLINTILKLVRAIVELVRPSIDKMLPPGGL